MKTINYVTGIVILFTCLRPAYGQDFDERFQEITTHLDKMDDDLQASKREMNSRVKPLEERLASLAIRDCIIE